MSAEKKQKIPRQSMPEQDPQVRARNFKEVPYGYSPETAMLEASRCPQCKKPKCVEGCPVNVKIPEFIALIVEGDFSGAARKLKEPNALPAVCGRVCPQESQCEAKCVVGKKKPAVAIGNLERFAADYERNSGKIAIPEVAEPNGIKVAVIGSGPAGLSAAGDLCKLGYDVTVFEALHEIGGVLKYGIPEFRLPNEIVNVEIDVMRKMGVKFRTNFIVGKTATIEDLKEQGYQAFFVGSGAGLPRFMNIPGENYNGIFSSNEYLTRVNLMNAANDEYDTPVISGNKVAVIGGGNTAMDSVRTSKRLGAERSIIIYRRSLVEMPARVEEVKHAQEEGIEFMNLHNPVEYFADENGRVNRMRVQKMELGEPDASGRRRPVVIPDSEFDIEVDTVVVSVGVSPNPLIPRSLPDLKMTDWGTIVVDKDTMQSSIPELFAGGDIVRGGATVILAMGDGRKAAAGMHKYIQEKIKK